MTRSIAIALAVGVLRPVFALVVVPQATWQALIAAWLGAPERDAEAKLAIEDWPICSTMGPGEGSEADWAQLDPDFAAGKKALVAEDWNGAITALKLAALRDPHNADIQNYIGYAYRRLRQSGPAMQHYHQQVCAQSPPPQRSRTPWRALSGAR